MWFRVEPGRGVPIYVQLMEQVRRAVASGVLAPGEQLPSVRELALQLSINPNTVSRAYQELEHEGIIYYPARPGDLCGRPFFEPELLLLDEPATGLDPLRRRQVLQLLVEEMAGGECTIIISSHQLPDVERIADRVGFLFRGKLILSRPLEQLLGEEKKLRVLFPGSPPEDLPGWPGVRRVAREGSHLLISLSGHLDEVLGRLNRYDGVAFEVLDQTLEDIFVEYAAGEEVNREVVEQ